VQHIYNNEMLFGTVSFFHA